MTEIAKEYATALFALALEEDKADEFATAITLIKNVFSQNGKYIDFLSCPSVVVDERLSAIRSAFSDSVPQTVISFLQLLCKKGRINCIFDAADEFIALYNASKKITNAVVTSAVKLNDKQKQRLEKKLEALYKCSINFDYKIDSRLLGGLTVEIDGKILDGSLSHRLHEIKEVMNT